MTAENDSGVQTHIGAAGWQLPKEGRERFPEAGSHLQRYSRVLNAVEINSTFKGSHQPSTYEKWAGAVPEGFAFAVKVSRAITHQRMLVDVERPLRRFLDEIAGLGGKQGPLLFQLPPRLAFDTSTVGEFGETLRRRYDGHAVVEPRHASWGAPEAERLLSEHRIARAAVDPARFDTDAEPGGWGELVYYRLHGSPKIYYSSYDDAFLAELAQRLDEHSRHAHEIWCIFDNTAAGAGTHNAVDLLETLRGQAGAGRT